MKTVFDSTGKVVGVIKSTPEVEANYIAQFDNTHHIHDGELSDPQDKFWDGTNIIDRPDLATVKAQREAKPTTTITMPNSAAKGTNVNGSIAVRDATTGAVIPVNETYFVPIMNMITNQLEMMLQVNVTNGDGTFSFQLANAGLYSFDKKHIRPVPTTEIDGQTDISIY